MGSFTERLLISVSIPLLEIKKAYSFNERFIITGIYHHPHLQILE